MMKSARLMIAFICLCPGIVHSQQDSVPEFLESVSFVFPNKTVDILKSNYKKANLNFLILHDNENTGVRAAHAFCKINGGSLTELQYGNTRNITFGSRRSLLSFDPNQIFNDVGAYLSLKRHSKGREDSLAVQKARDLARLALKVYNPDTSGYIITLHNNSDGKFSIESYLEGNYLHGTADSVYINPAMDPDDLVLVTDPAFFNFLKQQNVNVVLQSPTGPADGSLSVYAQVNKIPYFNIEVQHGHLAENIRLIYVVESMFKTMGINEEYAQSR